MPRAAPIWVTLVVCSALYAQEQPGGRIALWDSLREKKAENLRPPVRSGLEKALYEIREQHVLERLMAGWHGFHPTFGGLHTGSGFALGTEWRQQRLGGGLFDVRFGARASFKAYQKYEVQVAMPRLLNERLFLDFTTTHRDFPQEDYFGLGPDSRQQDRSNFRLEDTTMIGTVGLRGWRKRLAIGFRGGVVDLNIGRGTDRRFPTVERVFNPSDTPGLDQHPDYYQFEAFAQMDWRDEPGNPRSGGNYLVEWNTFGDRDLARFSFRRYEAEIQQYVPFFNRRRVFAFRGKTVLTDTGSGHAVPFYMMQTLGGSEDLRGFREFRFRDNNLMVMNLEYRWEVFSGMDMALFGDAGKVFPRRDDLDLEDLEAAYGVGFRFNQAKSVFLRIDIGKSHEGLRFFFKFGHVF